MNKETFSRESLLEFLRLHPGDQRTLNTYIKEGILPEPTIVDKEQFFSKEVVLKIMGCKRDPQEPFITPGECAEMLGIDKVDIAGYVKRKNIPYYRLGSKKGHRTLYLASEINAAISLELCWFGLDNFKTLSKVSDQTLVKLICSDFTNVLSEMDRKYLKAIIVDKISLTAFAKSEKVSKESIRQRFEQAYLNFNIEFDNIEKEIKNTQALINTVEQQNIELKHLKETNERLSGIISEQSKERQKAIEISTTKPFHQLDMSSRAKKFLERNEIKDLYQLCEFNRSFVAKFRDLGAKTLDELDQLLKHNGLKWKD